MAFRNITQQIGMPIITSHETTQDSGIALGQIIQMFDSDNKAGEFIYLKGVASTAVGSWVTYNADDYTTTLAVANAVGPVAIAMSACVAGEYGWYQISGKASGLCLSGFLDNADVYLTSTDGSVDDTDVAGDYVNGAKGASARDTTTGLAEFELWRPRVADGKDN